MRTHRLDATVFGAASLLTFALCGVAAERLAAPAPVATGLTSRAPDAMLNR